MSDRQPMYLWVTGRDEGPAKDKLLACLDEDLTAFDPRGLQRTAARTDIAFRKGQEFFALLVEAGYYFQSEEPGRLAFATQAHKSLLYTPLRRLTEAYTWDDESFPLYACRAGADAALMIRRMLYDWMDPAFGRDVERWLDAAEACGVDLKPLIQEYLDQPPENPDAPPTGRGDFRALLTTRYVAANIAPCDLEFHP